MAKFYTCDKCNKKIRKLERNSGYISWSTNEKDLPSDFDLCEKCAEPIKGYLRKFFLKKLVKKSKK